MIEVALPQGVVTVSSATDEPERPWARLVLAHGAGAGMEHPFLAGFAAAMAAEGVAVLRFQFPYREAGRRMPGPAAHAVATWAAAMATLASSDVPVFAGGKSYGGRMASMAAAEGRIAPAGLVYLGYPLHPPGAPEKARTAHLPKVAPPQLFVTGTVDPFVQPVTQLEAAVATCQDASIVWVAGGGHSFEVAGNKRAPEVVGGALAALVASWMRARV